MTGISESHVSQKEIQHPHNHNMSESESRIIIHTSFCRTENAIFDL